MNASPILGKHEWAPPIEALPLVEVELAEPPIINVITEIFGARIIEEHEGIFP